MSSSRRGRSWHAIVLLTRADLRRSWRSLVSLAVIAAIAVAAVMVALTAATRSENAFTRLRAATHASDAVVDYSARGVQAEGASGAVDAIRKLQGVEDAASDAELFVRPLGSKYFPDYDLYARAPLDPRDTHI